MQSTKGSSIVSLNVKNKLVNYLKLFIDTI